MFGVLPFVCFSVSATCKSLGFLNYEGAEANRKKKEETEICVVFCLVVGFSVFETFKFLGALKHDGAGNIKTKNACGVFCVCLCCLPLHNLEHLKTKCLENKKTYKHRNSYVCFIGSVCVSLPLHNLEHLKT